MDRRATLPCLTMPRPVARIGIALSLGFLALSVSVPALGVRASRPLRGSESPWAHSARIHREPVLRVAHADGLRAALQRWGWNERRLQAHR